MNEALLIKNALEYMEENGYKTIHYEILAKRMGFNPMEIDRISTFINPVLYNYKILISDEHLLDYFGYKKWTLWDFFGCKTDLLAKDFYKLMKRYCDSSSYEEIVKGSRDFEVVGGEWKRGWYSRAIYFKEYGGKFYYIEPEAFARMCRIINTEEAKLTYFYYLQAENLCKVMKKIKDQKIFLDGLNFTRRTSAMRLQRS